MNKNVNMLLTSALGSGPTIAVFILFGLNQKSLLVFHDGQNPVPVHKTGYTVKEKGELVPLEFIGVSKEVMSGVAHIKSILQD